MMIVVIVKTVSSSFYTAWFRDLVQMKQLDTKTKFKKKKKIMMYMI